MMKISEFVVGYVVILVFYDVDCVDFQKDWVEFVGVGEELFVIGQWDSNYEIIDVGYDVFFWQVGWLCWWFFIRMMSGCMVD